jgi:hypothetical protein
LSEAKDVARDDAGAIGANHTDSRAAARSFAALKDDGEISAIGAVRFAAL